jgi:hypothetical protein
MEAVSGASKKYVSTPHLGDARRPFRCQYPGAIGQDSRSRLFSTRERLAGNSWPTSPHGFEVLVNYALDPIKLTNQFLRFPLVRQQTRGNFSFLAYSCWSSAWERHGFSLEETPIWPRGSRRGPVCESLPPPGVALNRPAGGGTETPAGRRSCSAPPGRRPRPLCA